MLSGVTWRDLEIIILGEISQIEGDKYHDITSYVESKKILIQMNLFTKQKQILNRIYLLSRLRKQTYGTKGER